MLVECPELFDGGEIECGLEGVLVLFGVVEGLHPSHELVGEFQVILHAFFQHNIQTFIVWDLNYPTTGLQLIVIDSSIGEYGHEFRVPFRSVSAGDSPHPE